MADLSCCLNGNDFWIETKIDRGSGPVLRPEQIAWHTRRQQVRSKTFVLARLATNLDTNALTLYRPNITTGAFVLVPYYKGEFPRIDWEKVLTLCCMGEIRS